MATALAGPFDPGLATRFGQWTLVRPGDAPPAPLLAGSLFRVTPVADQAVELYLYHGDGNERALLLSFGQGRKTDRVVLRSGLVQQRLTGCRSGLPAGLRSLKSLLGSAEALKRERPELPDDSLLRIGDGERGLRRVGEELVADLAGFRVRLLADSDTVYVGETESGDFCRFETGKD